MNRKGHEDSSQMAGIFARDAPVTHAKDFTKQNMQKIKQTEQEVQSRA